MSVTEVFETFFTLNGVENDSCYSKIHHFPVALVETHRDWRKKAAFGLHDFLHSDAEIEILNSSILGTSLFYDLNQSMTE